MIDVLRVATVQISGQACEFTFIRLLLISNSNIELQESDRPDSLGFAQLIQNGPWVNFYVPLDDFSCYFYSWKRCPLFFLSERLTH